MTSFPIRVADAADAAVVAADLMFPEGPVAFDDGSVLATEIGRGRLTVVGADGGTRVAAKTGGGPNGAAIGPDGWCYVCNNGGFEWAGDAKSGFHPAGRSHASQGGSIQRANLSTGEVQTLYTRGPNAPLSGPNDIVFDEHGGFWFTDLGHMEADHVERGRVYYARTDGSLIVQAVAPLLTPNGIGLSPDGGTLYVAETLTARLWAFDIEGPGKLRLQSMPPELSPGRLLYAPSHMCMFDSLAVEAGGNVCVATIGVAGKQGPGGSGISVISPQGELVEFVSLPDRATTNICFGGADMRSAWITQSRTGKLVRMRWPRPGLRLHGQR